MDRKRNKKMSNDEWLNPNDPEAEITRMKDGRTALAYKAEQAVDMASGAIVAVTTHGGAAADTQTIGETVPEAGIAVAEVMVDETSEGECVVNAAGIEEVVADKGYHSNSVLAGLSEMKLRTYIAEPDRGRRQWSGKEEEKAAVYANRRRIGGARGKRLLAQRGERIERNFAHQYDTGGMDRMWVRGRENVHKKLLIQAAACNLALMLRAKYGSGKPKAAHERGNGAVFVFIALLIALKELCEAERGSAGVGRWLRRKGFSRRKFSCRPRKRAV
jgi:transposase